MAEDLGEQRHQTGCNIRVIHHICSTGDVNGKRCHPHRRDEEVKREFKVLAMLFGSFGSSNCKDPTETCSDDHVGADLLQPLLRCLHPVQFLHADPRGRPLGEAVQPDVGLQPPQDVWVTVSEHVSAGAAGATDGHTRQAHTAAKL